MGIGGTFFDIIFLGDCGRMIYEVRSSQVRCIALCAVSAAPLGFGDDTV
jgi:hypothetical protein